MKRVGVGELKTNFSEILEDVMNGERVAIQFGRKKKVVALLVPAPEKKPKRKLGILENKASFEIRAGYKMTDEELLLS